MKRAALVASIPIIFTLFVKNHVATHSAILPIATNEEECVQLLNEFGYCHWRRQVLSNETLDMLYQWCTNDKNIKTYAREITQGRFHTNLFSTLLQKPFSTQQSKELITTPTELQVIAMQYLQTEQIKQTQFQLVLPRRDSVSQFWHQDNSHKGITIVIPLVDIEDETRGPTELLPLKKQQGVIRATIPKNQIFVFDSRMLHRGLANKDEQVERPILVIRFDKKSTPPPGQGVLQTCYNRFISGPIQYLNS